MINRANKIFFITLIFSGVLLALPALGVGFEVTYPKVGPSGIGPGGGPLGWVQYIFYFGLIVTGIAAVGSLIYAGIIWMTSEVSGKIQEAKSRIWAAILGVLIVAGSVVILNIINPDLVSLRAPTVPNILNKDFSWESFGKTCTGTDDSECGGEDSETYCNTSLGQCLFKRTGEGGVGLDCTNNPTACGGRLVCDGSVCVEVPGSCRIDSDCIDVSRFSCKNRFPEASHKECIEK